MKLDMSSCSKYYTIRVLYIVTFIEITNDSLKTPLVYLYVDL